jgi:hypothetical protein
VGLLWNLEQEGPSSFCVLTTDSMPEYRSLSANSIRCCVCATRANVIRRAKKLVLGIAGDIEKLAGAVVCQVSLLIVNWNELPLKSEL